MVDTVKSLSALQALLPDNTDRDISPQDLRDFLVSADWWATQRAWGLPVETPGDDDILWDGSESMTTVTVTGTQTVTQGYGRCSVSFQDQAVNDFNCLLKARTFSVGDTFVMPLTPHMQTLENFSFSGLVFTDGTTAASNAVASFAYLQTAATGMVVEGASGTLTNMTLSGTIIGNLIQASIWVRLIYTASNSFHAAFSRDGVHWVNSHNLTPTLTPTHIGILWSSWNASATDGIRETIYGPIVQTA